MTSTARWTAGFDSSLRVATASATVGGVSVSGPVDRAGDAQVLHRPGTSATPRPAATKDTSVEVSATSVGRGVKPAVWQRLLDRVVDDGAVLGRVGHERLLGEVCDVDVDAAAGRCPRAAPR